MSTVVHRIGLALGAFVVAWLAVSLVAGWLFGSGNSLVWVFATVVGAAVYLLLLRGQRRSASLQADPSAEDAAAPRG